MAVKTVVTVKAKELGFYGSEGHLSTLQKPGTPFHLRKFSDFSPKWMEFNTPEDEALHAELLKKSKEPAAPASAAPAKPVPVAPLKPAAPASAAPAAK